jgi:hypothetical protein
MSSTSKPKEPCVQRELAAQANAEWEPAHGTGSMLAIIFRPGIIHVEQRILSASGVARGERGEGRGRERKETAGLEHGCQAMERQHP